MSLLTIHSENNPETAEVVQNFDAIAKRLNSIGVLFEHWEAEHEFDADATQKIVLSAYSQPLHGLKEKYGFQSADVISVMPDHPEKAQLRAKFINEHTHSDFEVRFFVQGSGLFFLHPDENVYAVLCERGDLISVPAHTKHWFDMGRHPNLKCIRLFTFEEGWVAEFTGSHIADYFPKYEEFVRDYA